MPAHYELPIEGTAGSRASTGESRRSAGLPESILSANALWFCQLRWIVVAILAGFGALNAAPGLASSIGLLAPGAWPFVTAAILVVANTLFSFHAVRSRNSASACRVNLWLQIVSDLIVLTVVVHYAGELQPIVSFAYLFHIVLACIFFDRRESLTVLALALTLYAVALFLRAKDITTDTHVFTDPSPPLGADGLLRWVSALLFCFFALVVWYLTSHLSAKVRERDHRLSDLNHSLLEAQTAKARHMLRTTHELKAPFAAIQANVQLLTKGYCGALPEPAVEVLERIDQRCRRLTNEIQEMLQLSNLRSAEADTLKWQTLDISSVLKWCSQQLQPLAMERNVRMDLHLSPAHACVVEEQIRVLFSNLLSNAIHYSQSGGQVTVSCRERSEGAAEVRIQDTGIGIEAEKLPLIFDEYYRTDRAAQHNKSSSGLGLAIVRHVAQTHAIRITVSSDLDVGTDFTLDFTPCKEGLTGGVMTPQQKER